MNILSKEIVLKLNRNWQPIDQVTVADAVTFLCSESGGQKPGFALDITTAVDENGQHVLVSAQPTTWDDWINLPVREEDLAINTSRGPIRVPLVVICAHFDKMPMKRPRWSVGNIHQRDHYVCAYTRRKLSRAQATVDHITPRSRGGRDTWDNTVCCDREVNTMKGNRTPEEAGLILHTKPVAPPALPVSATIREAKHPVWEHFLVTRG